MAKAVLNTYKFAAVSVTLMLVAAGCASKSVNSADPSLALPNEYSHTAGSQSASSSLSLIARDFAHILPQISVLRPDKIALSVIPDDDGNVEFAEALRHALFQQGYAVKIGGGNFSSTDLTYQIVESGLQKSGLTENEPEQVITLYQLEIGDISLRRRYSERSAGQVQPVSTMEGRGFDPTAMVVDKSIFGIGDNNLVGDNTTPTMQATGNITPATGNNPPGLLPRLIYPLPGTQLSGSDVIIMWDDNGLELDQWFLRVGLSEGTAEFAEVRLTNPATTEYQVSALPTNGVPIFVELSFRNDGVWTAQNFEYTAFDDNAASPTGLLLDSDSVAGVAGAQSVTGNVATNNAIPAYVAQQSLVYDADGTPGNAMARADATNPEDIADESIGLLADAEKDSQSAAAAVRFSSVPFDETSHFRDPEHSNFPDLLKETVVVDILVAEFVKNSPTLLPNALARVNKLAANVVGSDDLIAVIGTSYGGVSYPDAQEDLARSRAIAVRNSLVAMGVESDNIFIEASWSDNYQDEVLQSRAAIVEVRRLAVPATSK